MNLIHRNSFQKLSNFSYYTQLGKFRGEANDEKHADPGKKNRNSRKSRDICPQFIILHHDTLKVTLRLLLCLRALFYFSFLYTYVCVFLHIQSPLRECRWIQSGASGLPYYCAPRVCVSDVMESPAVCWHNKPKTKNL